MVKSTENEINGLDYAISVIETSHAELDQVRFVGCNCEIMGLPDDENSYDVTATTEYEIEEENKELLVLVHLNWVARNLKNEHLAKISADLFLSYRLDNIEGMASQNYQNFADYAGVFHAWPYWREFVQSMTARMQLPSLTLEAFRFGMLLPTASNTKSTKRKKKTTKSKTKTTKKKATKKKT